MNSYKNLKKRIVKFANNPFVLFRRFNHTKIQRLLPDEIFLKLMFRARMGCKLDLENPKSFNEKLQWLKIHNRNPKYTKMVDKYEAKGLIASIVGKEYVVPTYGVWDSFSQIDFSQLPSEFVLKTTHDGGRVFICRNKDTFDYCAARESLSKGLKTNFFWQGREWPYKNVKPRIIAEALLKTNSDSNESSELVDYKVMCFNGVAKYCFTCTGRHSENGLHVTFFDRDWKKMPFQRHYPVELGDIQKPENYCQMLTLAEKLADNMPFLRVDFYEVDGKLYVGELTLYPGNGYEEFFPAEWDDALGEMIKLP